MKFRFLFLFSVFLAGSLASAERLAAGAAVPSAEQPHAIASVLKPAVYRRMLEEREVMVHASLKEGESYSYYAAMLVRAELAVTRRVLTDYQLYAKMIPYIERAAFDAKSGILAVEGGLWKFRLSSQVRFYEQGERWIRYEFVGGHFQGMTGEILFEPLGEKGTAVYMSGFKKGEHWPPKFVIERGAEIVFEFTAKRMRSYIESQKNS
ncbi:MAG: hypothetical protein NDJ90_04090 [Oligoflexia bacterium]|nr:hypothetical protein [Oligoflexia bacterium]